MIAVKNKNTAELKLFESKISALNFCKENKDWYIKESMDWFMR